MNDVSPKCVRRGCGNDVPEHYVTVNGEHPYCSLFHAVVDSPRIIELTRAPATIDRKTRSYL